MKKPSLLSKLKIEYLLPFQELGFDLESEQTREIGKKLKKFYFGFSAISPETVFVYLMVKDIFDFFFVIFYNSFFIKICPHHNESTVLTYKS